MSYIIGSANEGLLSYTITTNPNLIRASKSTGDLSKSSITITVSNNTKDNIYCNKITFSLPIGNNAQDLTNNSKSILFSSCSGDKWQISMTANGVFSVTPINPIDNLIIDSEMSFQLYNVEVNEEIGSFTLCIDENSSLDNKNFKNKSNKFYLSKFPYGFYVSDFISSKPIVNDGESAILSWSGSDNATYSISYGTRVIDMANERSWETPTLIETTTFALKASVEEQGKILNSYLYVTVTVNQPEVKSIFLSSKQSIKIDKVLLDSSIAKREDENCFIEDSNDNSHHLVDSKEKLEEKNSQITI